MRTNKSKNTLIYGVGINDADYPVSSFPKRYNRCPYYKKWIFMLKRCYGKNNSSYKSYKGVTVNPIWHRFSNFKKWMEQQPYWNDPDMELDKDILVEGNKEYGPDTCMFVPQAVNAFFITPGVGYWITKDRISGKIWTIGKGKYFHTKEEAQIEYLNAKIKRGEYLVNTIIKEEKVKIAVMNRLVPYRNLLESLTKGLQKPVELV